jgi:hypothetical protein
MSKVQPLCFECATAYTARAAQQRFCTPACSKVFNNRRMRRGAVLVDLAMTDYCHRDHPKRKNGDIQKAMRRLLSRWRDEDRAANGGKGRAHASDLTEFFAREFTLTADYIYSTRNPWAKA